MDWQKTTANLRLAKLFRASVDASADEVNADPVGSSKNISITPSSRPDTSGPEARATLDDQLSLGLSLNTVMSSIKAPLVLDR